METNSNQTNTGGLAYGIIGLVLLAAIIGGIYFYSSSSASKTTATATNTNKTATPKADVMMNPNASAGANPANFKGGVSSPVVVEEFADFQCGACGATHPIMNEINGIYGSRIKFIFRDFPLQMHPKAYDAAVAAEAAGQQGKFWEMHNLLFTNQAKWSAETDHRKVFEDYAQKLGLDVEKFKSDMAGIATKQRVDADMQRGKSAGVTSTPTIYINGKSVPFEQVNVSGLKQIIDAELAKTGGK